MRQNMNERIKVTISDFFVVQFSVLNTAMEFSF